MKSTPSAFVVLCLVASLLTGCATARGPRQLEGEFGAGTAESSWSRVGELRPAAEVVVTIRGSQPGIRRFVLADEFGITMLNLSDSRLPPAASRVLREMAATHPEYFAVMQRSGSFEQDNVRVGRDGLFVADRKVADLGQVVERVARSDIAEIRGPVVARGSVAGAVLGGWVGFAVGAVPALGGASEVVAWSILIGAVAVGGFLGSHWSSHETEGTIYRAP